MTGTGRSGSWQIRGQQLGAAIGAMVLANAWQCTGVDLAVVVKRPPKKTLSALHKAGVPVIWDIVDAWPQPVGNAWDRGACMSWLTEQVKSIRPSAIVAATQAMAMDCKDFGIPVLALPHHARPAMPINPIRQEVRMVGYEGGGYLGNWAPFLEEECASRGWRFAVNPPALADVDIVVAVRETQGYAPRNWKSNVKLANAQGSSTPCILNREAGYIETETGGEFWADSQDEMRDGLSHLALHKARHDAAGKLHAGAPQIESVAETYAAWLRAL